MGNKVVLEFLGDPTSLERASKKATQALDSVQTSSDKLGTAFGKTADGMDKKSDRIGNTLERFGKNVLEKVGDIGTKLPGILGSSIEGLPPQGKALGTVIIGGLAAFLIPAIGVAISSAILLGLGGGVLALGIKSAMNDPGVTNALSGLKDRAKSVFTDFGKPFIEPVKNAVNLLSQTIEFMRPFAERIGKAIAPLINEIAPAVSAFLMNTMPSLTSAIEASIPLFEVIAKHAPVLGEKVGQFLEKIAGTGPAAAAFLDDVFDVLEWVIDRFGDWVVVMAVAYTAIKMLFRNAKARGLEFWDWIKDLPGRIRNVFVNAAGATANAIAQPFKSAFQGIKNYWNSTIGGKGFSFPGWLGGASFTIPRFHTGGKVPGSPSTESLAILRGGETVNPGHAESGAMKLVIDSGGSQLDDLLIEILSKAVRGRGGNVQLVLGGRNA